MRTFRTIQYTTTPRWMCTGDGEKLQWICGLVTDALLQKAHDLVIARCPDYAPSDALAALGRDRKIIRGINELPASYAVRLKRWLLDHRKRGNPFALMEQLRAYCNADVRIRTVDRRGNWFMIDRDGSYSWDLDLGDWDWDGGALTAWSRFWVIIYPTSDGLPWRVTTWTDFGSTMGEFEATKTFGTTATQNEVASVRAIIRDWKPGGTKCEWIIISPDDAMFDPSNPSATPSWPAGDWGKYGKDITGLYSQIRELSARYWPGSTGEGVAGGM